MDDFEFGLGDTVMVGTQQATVCGQATFSAGPDTYQLLFNDIDGLPEKRWFDETLISKPIQH